MKSKSDQELHFESVTNFLKWTLGIIATSLSVIIAFGIYFTYSSASQARSDMKEFLKETKESLREVDDRSKKILDETKNNAITTIGYIKNDAVNSAILASREKVEQTFKDDNIKGLIEDVAHSEIESRVQTMIDNQINTLSNTFSNSQNQMPVFMLALDNIRWNDVTGLYTLDSIYQMSKDLTSKNIARTLMLEKGKGYKLSVTGYVTDYYEHFNIEKDSSNIGIKKLVLKLKNDILKRNVVDLDEVTHKTLWLSKLLNRRLDVFDLDAIRTIK